MEIKYIHLPIEYNSIDGKIDTVSFLEHINEKTKKEIICKCSDREIKIKAFDKLSVAEAINKCKTHLYIIDNLKYDEDSNKCTIHVTCENMTAKEVVEVTKYVADIQDKECNIIGENK